MVFLKMIYLKDKIHFKGKYLYCCIWKNRLRHRFGFYLTSDGTTFCGEMNIGNINGNRCFKWRTNVLCDNDLMDGYEEYYYKNNDKFIGYYKDLKYDEFEHI